MKDVKNVLAELERQVDEIQRKLSSASLTDSDCVKLLKTVKKLFAFSNFLDANDMKKLLEIKGKVRVILRALEMIYDANSGANRVALEILGNRFDFKV